AADRGPATVLRPARRALRRGRRRTRGGDGHDRRAAPLRRGLSRGSAADGAHRARWLEEAGLVDPVAWLLARQAGVDQAHDLLRVAALPQWGAQVGLALGEEAR